MIKRKLQNIFVYYGDKIDHKGKKKLRRHVTWLILPMGHPHPFNSITLQCLGYCGHECTMCGATESRGHWNRDDNLNFICRSCHDRVKRQRLRMISESDKVEKFDELLESELFFLPPDQRESFVLLKFKGFLYECLTKQYREGR